MNADDRADFPVRPPGEDTWTPRQRLAHQLRLGRKHQDAWIVVRTDDVAAALETMPGQDPT